MLQWFVTIHSANAALIGTKINVEDIKNISEISSACLDGFFQNVVGLLASFLFLFFPKPMTVCSAPFGLPFLFIVDGSLISDNYNNSYDNSQAHNYLYQ